MSDCWGNKNRSNCIDVDLYYKDNNIEITSGESLTSALIKILSIRNQPTLQNTVDSNCLTKGNQSLCYFKLTNKIMTYKTSITSNNELFFYWDFSDIKNNLPEGFNIVSSSVIASSTKQDKAPVKGSSYRAGFTIPATNFPINIDINLRINTTCGQLEMYNGIYLTNPTIKDTSYLILNVKDYGSSEMSVLTEQQLNQVIISSICALKEKVTYLEEVTKSYTEIVEKIHEIEKKLNG